MSKLLARYRDEWTRLMVVGSFSQIWFHLEYGPKLGEYHYRRKAKTLEKRMKFLEKRIQELRKKEG